MVSSSQNGQKHDEKVCFVISPIGSAGSEIRKRADQVLNHVIRPPLEALNYTVVRADKIDDPGMITSQILDRIRSDNLVVADLAGNNPNVFYELAVRHGLGLPAIHLHAEGETIPFDVSGSRSISLDYRDLDSAASAREEIRKQAEAIEKPDYRVSNPLSFSFDMKAFEQSGNLEEHYLSELMGMISTQQRQLHRMERRLEVSESQEALMMENAKLRSQLMNIGKYKTRKISAELSDEPSRKTVEGRYRTFVRGKTE